MTGFPIAVEAVWTPCEVPLTPGHGFSSPGAGGSNGRKYARLAIILPLVFAARPLGNPGGNANPSPLNIGASLWTPPSMLATRMPTPALARPPTAGWPHAAGAWIKGMLAYIAGAYACSANTARTPGRASIARRAAATRPGAPTSTVNPLNVMA